MFQCFILIKRERISVPACTTHRKGYTQPKLLFFIIDNTAKSCHWILLFRLKPLLLLTRQKRSSTTASLLGGTEIWCHLGFKYQAKLKLLINVEFKHTAHVKNKQYKRLNFKNKIFSPLVSRISVPQPCCQFLVCPSEIFMHILPYMIKYGLSIYFKYIYINEDKHCHFLKLDRVILEIINIICEAHFIPNAKGHQQ